ncbi:DUF397 domain-containing protein [Streptomyces sp. NBC_00690]|uniref:DUF397 domain-containing protein n=1 Tax=Streptomyces sp. NBC_00690 TaxID=2975808 RepID=UPI002E2E4743|nr:DUF397 domain-containing protein [Streptomyces sp. NBC_00690]
MSAPIHWQKSTFSGAQGEDCVEIAEHANTILIRESETPSAVITTDRDKLAAFIQGVKAGEFDHFLD